MFEPIGADEMTEDLVRSFKELLERMAAQNAQFSEEEVAEDVTAAIQSVRDSKSP